MKAYLFPGQGTQFVGMGKAFYDFFKEVQELFAEASRVVDWDIKTMCFAGPEALLRRTEFAQVAIVTVSLAIMKVLYKRGFFPDVVAGHSVGEVTALVASGALDLHEGVRLAFERGKLMQSVERKGGMMALQGKHVIELVLPWIDNMQKEGYVVDIALFNAPEQIIISGDLDALQYFARVATSFNSIRMTPLKVSHAFHSRHMSDVKTKWQAVVDKTPMKRPSIPVITNIDGTMTENVVHLKNSLIQQMDGPVRWTDVHDTLIQLGVKEGYEIGASKVLAGLSRLQTSPFPVTSVDRPEKIKLYFERHVRTDAISRQTLN